MSLNTPRLMISLIGLMIFAPSIVSAQSQVAQPLDDKNTQLLQDLLQLNDAFVTAAKEHNAAKMKELTSSDFIAVDPYFPYMLVGEDVISDEQIAWDNYFKRPNGDEVVVRHPSQAQLRRFGDVAVLSYVELDAVKTRGERMRGGRAGKCTFVYHNEGGRWLLVNSEISAQSWPGSVLFGSGQ